MLRCNINLQKFGIALVIITACIIFIFCIDQYYFPANEHHHYIYINVTEKVSVTDEMFLSVALDTSFMNESFGKLNFSDWQKLQNLAQFLEPAYLRLGGTAADLVLFKLNKNNADYKNFGSSASDPGAKNIFPKNYLFISGQDWLKFNDFIRKSKLKLLFDLNVLLRNGSSWDSRNAKDLLLFAAEHDLEMDFQLGNEPNSFQHVFNISITPSQLGQDFRTLHEILAASKRYRNSKLVGPDVTCPKFLEESSLDYLKNFLMTFRNVNAVSWHQYYLNGRTAQLDQFVDPEVFELLSKQINAVKDTVQRFSSDMPVWLTETSTAYGGGAPGLSDRFVASFMWLDKLGLAAKMGVKVVIRQTLFQGDYSLIDKNLIPLPDYWISLFYKFLVGRAVLDVHLTSRKKANFLRFYAHCLKNNTMIDGNVILFGMNLRNTSEYVTPGGVIAVNHITPLIFTPADNNLLSKSVLLNGKQLEFFKDKNKYFKHFFEPAIQYANLPLHIPPYSIAFWIFHGQREKICFVN